MMKIYKLNQDIPKLSRPQNAKTFLNIINIFLIISLTLLIVGVISSFLCYTTYIAGTPAHLYSGRFGTRYVPEIASGDPIYKNLAIFSFKVASIGLLSSMICFAIKYTHKTKNED